VVNGHAILAEAHAIVGPQPAPFRGEVEAWEDRVGSVCLALVERSHGRRVDPLAIAKAELQRQRQVTRVEAPLFSSVTGDDLDDS
jgi:hypothetical protein